MVLGDTWGWLTRAPAALTSTFSFSVRYPKSLIFRGFACYCDHPLPSSALGMGEHNPHFSLGGGLMVSCPPEVLHQQVPLHRQPAGFRHRAHEQEGEGLLQNLRVLSAAPGARRGGGGKEVQLEEGAPRWHCIALMCRDRSMWGSVSVPHPILPLMVCPANLLHQRKWDGALLLLGGEGEIPAALIKPTKWQGDDWVRAPCKALHLPGVGGGWMGFGG